MGYFPDWRPAAGATVLPDEKLPLTQAVPMSLQHLLAMSGSTILAPLIMGFDPNVAVFFSGIGTLLFFAVTGGRVPSYLGSSFASSLSSWRRPALPAAGRTPISPWRLAASSPRPDLCADRTGRHGHRHGWSKG